MRPSFQHGLTPLSARGLRDADGIERTIELAWIIDDNIPPHISKDARRLTAGCSDARRPWCGFDRLMAAFCDHWESRPGCPMPCISWVTRH